MTFDNMIKDQRENISLIRKAQIISSTQKGFLELYSKDYCFTGFIRIKDPPLSIILNALRNMSNSWLHLRLTGLLF
jgi:hypothetical protein